MNCFACSDLAIEEIRDTDGQTKPVCPMHAAMVRKQGGAR
jgi:hypothetical protein